MSAAYEKPDGRQKLSMSMCALELIIYEAFNLAHVLHMMRPNKCYVGVGYWFWVCSSLLFGMDILNLAPLSGSPASSIVQP